MRKYEGHLIFSDLMAGVFSVLSLNDMERLDNNPRKLSYAFKKSMHVVETEAEKAKLHFSFRLKRNRSGISRTVNEEIRSSVKRGILSKTDGVLEFAFGKEDSNQELQRLSNRELYETVASAFLDNYSLYGRGRYSGRNRTI